MRNWLATLCVCVFITIGSCTVERTGTDPFVEETTLKLDSQIMALSEFINPLHELIFLGVIDGCIQRCQDSCI